MTHRQRVVLRDLETTYRRSEAYWTKHWADRIAFYEGLRREYPTGHFSLPLDVARAKQARAVEAGRIHADDPTVVRLRRWILTVCDREKIAVSYALTPSLRNGIASRSERCVAVAPLRSIETITTLAHEVGHVLAPPAAGARWVPTADGGSACVEGELAAWRWAMRSAPAWTRAMHDWMHASLVTYRPLATAAEQRELDGLCGNIGFRREELRRETCCPNSRRL